MIVAHKSIGEAADGNIEVRHTEALLITGALQTAIFNSANFSSIATDAKGVIQAEVQSEAIRASELSYRRLFEAAKDGILILDVDTGRINAVNPFLVKLLSFSPSEIVGKTVGELGRFKDIESNRAMLERLPRDGHVRYEEHPCERDSK